MYNSFDECMRALLNDERLDKAQGGQIRKRPEGFAYRLNGQPDVEGTLFLELALSATPVAKWQPLPVTKEAKRAFEAFISDPNNGELIK